MLRTYTAIVSVALDVKKELSVEASTEELALEALHERAIDELEDIVQKRDWELIDSDITETEEGDGFGLADDTSADNADDRGNEQ